MLGRVDRDRKEVAVLPASVDDYLPADHLARYVVKIVDSLDLSSIESTSSVDSGRKSYDPRVMVSLLIYGYSVGVSSRSKLEQATHERIDFMFITCDGHPDHDTIASFRQRHGESFAEIFQQVLYIAHRHGLLQLGSIALDGTKVKASAAREGRCNIELPMRAITMMRMSPDVRKPGCHRLLRRREKAQLRHRKVLVPRRCNGWLIGWRRRWVKSYMPDANQRYKQHLV